MPSSWQWLFPIIGQNEYSGGSWMPDTLNHRGRTHAAIDIYAAAGSPIIAPVSGVIQRTTDAAKNELGGYTVTLKGDDGYTYYFAHMQDLPLVKTGTRIQAGATLGLVGNSGSARTTSAHLHFSMKKGSTSVNPKRFLDQAMVIPEGAATMAPTAPGGAQDFYAGVEMVDPITAVEQAMLHGTDPAPQTEFTSQQFVSSALEALSTSIHGTQDRMDPMTIGQVDVPRSRLAAPTVDESAPPIEGEVTPDGGTP